MRRLLFLLSLLLPLPLFAASGFDAVTVTTNPEGGETYSLSIQLLLLMTVLSFLPAAVMMMTAFTRIIIVLAILRQAIGLMQAPSGQVMVGLALFLTFFVMTPVIEKMNSDGLQPYFEDRITLQQALQNSSQPLREFMLGQVRQPDLELFGNLAGGEGYNGPEDVPLTVLIPAFVTSELKTAFQIGFLLFIPFLIIDLVVASVLMSMGMMMLSPMIVSLPFKIMLFVLVDGWGLVMSTLASSFYVTP
ncbi:MAG: flagellar type III secretion system pore protein FliP [Gammaproteobacteria bacterium]|nr:flagellar type III secretion system pore protein FliP [Gammaproteobacteria bacterium]